MYHWDGSAWVPTGASPASEVTRRRPSSWTRPLQWGVIAVFGAQALYAASLPFWFINVMTQYANAMNARFGNPPFDGPGTPPPDVAAPMAQASQSANTIATIEFGVVLIVGILVSLAVIVAATRLWEWAFYAALVILGLDSCGSVRACSSRWCRQCSCPEHRRPPP